MPKKLPFYNLTEVTKYPPEILLKADQKEAGFIIALASFYNDFKDIYWMWLMLDEGKDPDASEESPYRAQIAGQGIFAMKYTYAIFWELIELFQAADKQKLFQSKGFKIAEAMLDPETREDWQELIRFCLCNGEEITDEHKQVLSFLNRVRSQVAFHYYETKNRFLGFKQYCKFADKKAKIWVSLGDTLEETRFFFADAANGARIEEVLNEKQLEVNNVVTYFKEVTAVIRFFIETYLEQQKITVLGNKKQKHALATYLIRR